MPTATPKQLVIASYTLRNIPADLWAAAKHAAIDRGISVRELILSALRKSVS